MLRDYALELDFLLQWQPTGNLTPFLDYVMSKEGRDDAPIDIAIATCEHLMVLHQSVRPALN